MQICRGRPPLPRPTFSRIIYQKLARHKKKNEHNDANEGRCFFFSPLGSIMRSIEAAHDPGKTNRKKRQIANGNGREISKSN